VANTTHQPLLSQERPGTLCAQVWVGFVVDLDWYQKMSTPSAFEPQTIQTPASCDTSCAVPAVIVVMQLDKYHKVTILH
jgi:hypothetical protein